jgi:hypothetical protein
MPINGQCGFVFLNNISAEGVARVAEHELGHGIFRLYHILCSGIRYFIPLLWRGVRKKGGNTPLKKSS